ncbi:MAG: AAA family ATPase, partial [Victivallales bacterium]|nr:AAA family ATPase [Victivallales bacterium]
MDCLICHRSNWMQEKTLGFLRNLLKDYKDKIEDGDVFQLLECRGADELLVRLVREAFPQEEIEKMSECQRRGRYLDLDGDSVRETLVVLWNRDEARPKLKGILQKLFDNALSTPWGEKGETDLFHDKMTELQSTLKLSNMEIDIMLVSLALQENILWDPRNERRGGSSSRNLFMISKCLNIKEATLLDIASSKKPLRRFECLDDDLDIGRTVFPFLCGFTDEPLANSYFTKDTGKTLPWSDFADLAKKHGTILKRMLTASPKPVNILLYGAPGTGKTSFARALAAEIGRTCYSIAQNTNDRGSRVCSSPDARFGALQVCDGQVTPEESLIIVDEADEMLRGHGGFGGLFMFFGGGSPSSSGDKGLLNSVLDTMKTSTIWITNTPARALDESSRRRFDYSIRFEPLNCEQRKRIWRNNIARLNMGRLISSRQLEEFSALYPVSAGGISQTLVNLERMHPRKSEVPQLVEQLMKPHCELLGVKLADDKLLPSKDYSLEGLNIQGDVQLERIVEAIRAFQQQRGETDPDRPRMNLLLSGAP